MSDQATSFSFEELLELMVETGLKFEEYTSDETTETREWLMFDFGKKLTDSQIEKLRSHCEVRFLSKGYIALRPKNPDLRDRFSKEALE